MAESFQKEKPPARVNLFLEVTKGTARKKVELPLRMLVVGDFSGATSDVALSDRQPLAIHDGNFEDVMKSADLEAEFTVPDVMSGKEGGEFKVDLKFDSMASFHPEKVAHQVSQISQLLATRNLLVDLRNRVVSMADFRRQLEEIVTDKDLLGKFAAELDKIIIPDDEQDLVTDTIKQG